MSLKPLFVGVLVTWRVASLLVNEGGPLDLFGHLRDWAGVRFDPYSQCRGDSMLANVLCCLWCCSVWVGWCIALITGPRRIAAILVNGLAYSAGAIVIQRYMDKG